MDKAASADKSKSVSSGTATVSAPASVPQASQPGAPAAPPPLDLKALEQRLRDTSAIGVFTKLSLKNQVDDLLQRFRAFHTKQSNVTLTDLRQRYESLLGKVLGLLQGADPDLARAIGASRESIWGILTDPQKFAAL